MTGDQLMWAQQNAQASQGHLSDYCAQNRFNQQIAQQNAQNLPPPYDGKGYWLRAAREMMASDLGIIDQSLDDKIGMEP